MSGNVAATAEYHCVQALLGRPRVVRRDDERDVGAEVDRRLGQLERLVELGRAGAGHERHPVGDLFGDDAHRGDPLGDGLRARLAGRSADRDAVRSGRRAATARATARPSWSTSPSAVNGVTTGAIEPRIECWVGSELHTAAFVSRTIAWPGAGRVTSSGRCWLRCGRRRLRSGPAIRRSSDTARRRTRRRAPGRG